MTRSLVQQRVKTLKFKKRTSLKTKLFKTASTELIPPLYLWIGLILLAIFTLIPFLYLITSSFSNNNDLINGHLIPPIQRWRIMKSCLQGMGLQIL